MSFASPPLPPFVSPPRPFARAPTFTQSSTFRDDVGDFVPSGRRGIVQRDYSPVTVAGDAAVSAQFLSYLDLKVAAVAGASSPTRVYNNIAIVAFLTSKINNASAEVEEEVTSATLSCVSLTDRFLPALKRLQIKECGEADEVGWGEVKAAVLSRAANARPPLVSKGTQRSMWLPSSLPPPPPTSTHPFFPSVACLLWYLLMLYTISLS